MTEALLSLAVVCGLLVLSQLSPGPDVFFIFRTALARGFRGGVAVATGINTGFCIQAIIVCTLGNWVAGQSWSRWVTVAAGCWLLYLAWRIFPRSRKGLAEGTLEGAGESARMSASRLFRQGFLCNILNPKCGLFIAGIVLSPLRLYGGEYDWYLPVLLVMLGMSSQLGWMLWCLLLQWSPIRSFYQRNTAPLDALFAVLLAFFAVMLFLP